ncbi:hypothetical protein LTR37_000888 [Vermiconidia calcicola]|uniref:Uncharacterized protein n=1 Tax=Vermiconidia calcicola TaxID=1690605 RepID=A0ACC3NYX6_9PEZI|nr:hypothetical protein LTR37_000888 [Vermiconidia calcicola]
MKFSIAAAVLSLTTATFALPQATYDGDSCLSQADAETIVARYQAVQAHAASDIGGPRKTARKILAKDFQESSDSLNSLIGLPLGTVTWETKADYIEDVLATDAAQLDTIQTLVSGCNYITWFWQAVNLGDFPVKGFHLFEINSKLKISEAWLEFNSIAWNQDLGGSCDIPSAITTSNTTGTTR